MGFRVKDRAGVRDSSIGLGLVVSLVFARVSLNQIFALAGKNN